MTLAPGDLVAGKWRVLRTLGRGSMSSVQEVGGPGGARCARKALGRPRHGGDLFELRARFEREAKVVGALSHPNVCPLLDQGTDPVPFLVMPLLDGEDLAAALARAGGPIAPAVAVAIAVQAARGLAAAHAAGVVHRDVKPSNLFLAGDPVAVTVLDFGLAKAEDAVPLGALTKSNRFLGTLGYMAPEQAHDPKRVDARSDVWGLAATLYHALSGAPPVESPGALLALVVDATGARPVRALQSRAPWVDGRLARVVHGALLRDRAARFPSVGELALALEMTVGFDAARAPIDRAALAPLPPEARAGAPRAELPRSWDELLRA